MATTNTRYVDPNAAAGGDGTTNALSGANCAYVSLSAWEAARQANLVTGDIIERVICSSDDSGSTHLEDTTLVVIVGWTTDATRYIQIESGTSHSGIWNDNIYRLAIADAAGLKISENYVRVIGLQVAKTSSSADLQACIQTVTIDAGGSDIRISSCILQQAGNNTYTEPGLYAGDADATVNVWNCIMYGSGTTASVNNAALFVLSATVNAYSCTLIGGYCGLRVTSAGVVNAKNCYAKGTVAYSSSATLNMTTCASSDTTAPGTALDSIAVNTTNFTNVTAGSEDFHLPAGSALIDVGTDTSGEGAPLNFTDDIDGDTRTGTWDIGADEYVSTSSTYNESATFALSAGLTRSTILSAINAATFALSAGLVRSNLATMAESIVLALSASQDQTGGADFNEAVILAVNAISAQTATVEMNAGLSLGIAAEQGMGSVAEMDAVLALSLAMAMLQAGSVDAGVSTYDEAVALATAMGMSLASIGTLQEAVTLATAVGQGQSGQMVMVNALVLQATASMIQTAVGSLSASLNLDVSMSEAFGTALILQASALLGATSGLSASGGLSLEDAATLGINAGMAQTVGYLLTAAVELNVQASQAQSATMTAEAQLALAIACSKIDSMGQELNVSLALSIVADMAQWGIVPRIAAARHLYNALARKREYDAKKRKREYDATARKREHDEE